MAEILIDSTHPYKPTLPAKGPMFIGRENEVNQLVKGLTAPEGDSFAVYGGRRFGKTSLLLEVQRQILEQAANPARLFPQSLRPLPVLISVSEYSIKSEQVFYQQVIEAINKQAVNIPGLAALIGDRPLKFVRADNIDDHNLFMDLVESLGRTVQNEHWRLILLIDEAELIAEQSWSKDLFTHLRGILEGRRGHLFKIVMAGSLDFYSKVYESGSPLIGLLIEVYLRNLSENETRRLISLPAGDLIPTEVVDRIYYHSGGHPYVTRWLMDQLWPNLPSQAPVDTALVDQMADRFLTNNRQQFNKWRANIGKDGLKIFGYLIKQHERSRESLVHVSQVKNDLRQKGDVGDQLITLLYHGFIEGDNGLRYRAAGEIFCRWYRENVDEEPASPLVTVSTIHVLPIALARSNRELIEHNFPPVRVRVDNRASNCRRTCVRLEVSIKGGFSDPYSGEYEVEQGDIQEFPVLPLLTDKALEVRAIHSTQVSVQVFDVTAGNKSLHSRSYDISLYPPDTAVLLLDLPDKPLPLFNSLSAWVTHTHDSLKEVIVLAEHKLAQPWIKGYSQNVDRLREQAGAIYAALQEYGLGYEQSTFVLKKKAGGNILQEMSQRVRLPRESLSTKKVNCLDGAVLFSSLLLAFNIHPVIVLITVPDFHAFAGWKLTKNGPVNDYRQLDFVDTSQFTSCSFDEARRSANARYREAREGHWFTRSPDDFNGFAAIIDVVDCLERQGYHPLE